MNAHIDKNPGITYGEVTYEHVINPNSRTGDYYVATAEIGSIFGQPVHGKLTGIGKTKDDALTRLNRERDLLYESLWV